LAVHYNLVLVDTGTGILHSATRGILDAADQLVVVVAPSLDGARAAAQTLDWLDQHGYAFLTRQAVAAVNRVGPTRRVQLDRIQRHFAERCRAVVRIPEDHHMHDGAQVSLDDLRPRTRTAYVELAAAVADGFSSAS
jgi:putative peptide zinc metalloprotease protein